MYYVFAAFRNVSWLNILLSPTNSCQPCLLAHRLLQLLVFRSTNNVILLLFDWKAEPSLVVTFTKNLPLTLVRVSCHSQLFPFHLQKSSFLSFQAAWKHGPPELELPSTELFLHSLHLKEFYYIHPCFILFQTPQQWSEQGPSGECVWCDGAYWQGAGTGV